MWWKVTFYLITEVNIEHCAVVLRVFLVFFVFSKLYMKHIYIFFSLLTYKTRSHSQNFWQWNWGLWGAYGECKPHLYVFVPTTCSHAAFIFLWWLTVNSFHISLSFFRRSPQITVSYEQCKCYGHLSALVRQINCRLEVIIVFSHTLCSHATHSVTLFSCNTFSYSDVICCCCNERVSSFTSGFVK